MTLIDPATTTTGRRKRRRTTSTSTSTTSKPGTGRGTRIVRGVLTALWLLGVPMVAAVHVDRLFGAAWVSIPAFWLDGDPAPAAFSVIGALALAGAVVIAALLHRQRTIFMFAVLPALVAWVGYVGFGGGVGGWLGLLAGLGVGAIAYAVRRRQAR